VTPVPRHVPTLYLAAASTHTSIEEVSSEVDKTTLEAQPDQAVRELRETTNIHSATLLDLKNCCVNLAASQQFMTKQLADMSESMNCRLESMATSIESLRQSPKRITKWYKTSDDTLH
jgi:uncharacterized protein YajQ (UPF0234 family)